MKKKDFPDNLGETTQNVAAKGRDALYQAGDYLNELGHILAPRASAFGKKSREFAEKNIMPRIENAREFMQPYVDDAYDVIAPRVVDARDLVENDLLPRVNDAIQQAAEHPTTQEATRRLTAARAALAGELYLPEPEPVKAKSNPFKTIFKVLLAGGLLAVIAFAIKKFLEPDDSGWQAHEPSAAYTPRPADVEAPAKEAKADQPVEAEVGTDDVEVEEVDEDAAEGDEAEDDAAPFADSPYGEGSYQGDNPPEGFVIKANERSMKYHVEGNAGFANTISNLWFNSEEAAEKAGFTRAQR